MKQKLSICLALTVTLLFVTQLVYNTQAQTPAPVYTFDSEMVSNEDNCRNEPEFDIIRADAQPDGSLNISKCDGSPFEENGRYEVWVKRNGGSDFDLIIASASYLSATVGSTISVPLDPVAEGLYGPHEYQVDLRSNDLPDTPKHSGTVRMWEIYDVPGPVGTHKFEVTDSGDQCGISNDIIRLEAADNNQQLEFTITKCDNDEFERDGMFYIAVRGIAASAIPRWGPIMYNSDEQTITITIDPKSLDLSGNISYQVQLYSDDQPTLVKVSAPVAVRDILGATPTPTPEPYIGIMKTTSEYTAGGGDRLTYTIQFSVTEVTRVVTIENRIPIGLSIVPGSLTGGANYSNGKVTFQNPIPPDTVMTITYQAEVDADVTGPSVIYDTSVLSGNGQKLVDSVGISIPAAESAKTLLLLYVNGDNDLTPFMGDLVNRAVRASNNPNVDILLAFDGPGEKDAGLYILDENGDKSCLHHDNPNCDFVEAILNPWEHISTPETLEDFVVHASGMFPDAEQILLSMVGHGGGIAPSIFGGQPTQHGGQPTQHGGQPNLINGQRALAAGLLWDENPQRSMSTTELGRALRNASEVTGRKIDLLYLDACYMAMTEVAYEVHDNVDYLLASENWSWTSFAYDKHIDIIDDQKTPAEIGKAWLNNEAEALLERNDNPFTLSLTDLKAMPEVITAVDGLGTALIDQLATDKDKIREAFGATDCFDSSQDGAINRDDSYCDLGSFASELNTTFAGNAQVTDAAQKVNLALTKAITETAFMSGNPWRYPSQHWFWHNPLGLSIYMPLEKDDWRRGFYNQFRITEDSSWGEFLDAYWGVEAPPFEIVTEDWLLPPGPLTLKDDLIELEANLDQAPGHLELSWHQVETDTVISSYRLEKYIQTEFAEMLDLGSLSTSQYIDNDNLLPGLEYCYRVWGQDAAGFDMAVSNLVCAEFGILTLSMPDQMAFDEDESLIKVPFTLIHADNLCLSSFNVTVAFDPKVVKFQHVIDLHLDGYERPRISGGNDGQGRLAIISTQGCQPLTSTHHLFDLTFRKLVPNGHSTITIVDDPGATAFYHIDQSDTPLEMAFDNGKITIGDGINDLTPGDVTLNGHVDSADPRAAIEIASGLISEPLSAQVLACDVHENSSAWFDKMDQDDKRRCRAGDATKILCYVARQSWDDCDWETQVKPTPGLTVEPIEISINGQTGIADTAYNAFIQITNGNDFAGGDFIIRYDPEQMTFQDVARTDLTERFLLAHSENQPGKIIIAMASDTPIGNDGPILNLRFTKIDQTESSVSFEKVFLNNEFGNDFDTELQKPIVVHPPYEYPVQIFLPIVGSQ